MKKKKNSHEMSFLEHLEELRWHLIRSTLAVIVLAAGAFFAKGFIFDTVIFGPKNPDFPTYHWLCNLSRLLGMENTLCITEIPFRIQSRIMAGQFSAHLWTSIWAGFIVGFPYILYETWRFISPGLYPKERSHAKGFIFIASLLFFLGVLFGYYIIAPLSVNFFATYQVSKEVFNDIDLSSYIATVRMSVVACGLTFELPIIMYFLSRLGIVTPQLLRKYRKHALVLVLILSAIITPPDVVSQVIVAIPILILYEVSIYISAIVLKKEKQTPQKT